MCSFSLSREVGLFPNHRTKASSTATLKANFMVEIRGMNTSGRDAHFREGCTLQGGMNTSGRDAHFREG